MDCCINDLGAKPHNEDLDLGIQAEQAGVHKAILFFAGARITRSVTFGVGDDVIIPRPFNELYQYKLQVIQPDGTLMLKDDCDTFAFKTYIAISENCGGCEEDEEEEPYL